MKFDEIELDWHTARRSVLATSTLSWAGLTTCKVTKTGFRVSHHLYSSHCSRLGLAHCKGLSLCSVLDCDGHYLVENGHESIKEFSPQAEKTCRSKGLGSFL